MSMHIFDKKYKKYENDEYKNREVQSFRALRNIQETSVN